MKNHFLVLALILVLSGGLAADGATIKGKFVYDGTAPEPAKLAITKDAAVCSKHPPVDESLVVGADGGIANVLIWVRNRDLESPAPEGKVVLDNLNCRFAPHVAVVHTGQILELKNSDSVAHNSNIQTLADPKNVSIPANGSLEHKFSAEERLPSSVSCTIHPWMKAYVLVRGNSYAAVTQPDGSFEITGLPDGEELEFQVWQEKAGYLADVTVDGSDPGWTRGRFKKTFTKDEVVDLGVIKVKPAAFED